ncbi:hypothetical protein LX16_5330 [Stackebrandtia albiflava]|uniref:Uncharacterized protein n=1 Tax=Stackebrandtia albiflava TaxID=406432 RepID=A0A562UL89_9ACTN|nr:hypothetical protein [Stackebrandtia albiflava]TWJ06366.1 hypothetical protein LX16_5330 [Stackebrandtia albiflava]
MDFDARPGARAPAAHGARGTRRAETPEAAGMLRWQRLAGNAAVARAVTRTESVDAADNVLPGRRPVVAQRDIGFEYEVNRETYQAATSPRGSDRGRSCAELPPWAVPGALGKGDVIVGGMGGVHAKVDEGGLWRTTNLELEIDPVPETSAGRRVLVTRLFRVVQFCALLDARFRDGERHVSAGAMAEVMGGDAPTPLRHMYVSGDVTEGNPQATAGIRLDRLATFMEQTVGYSRAAKAADDAAGRPRSPTRLEPGWIGSPAEPHRMGDAPGLIEAACQALAAERLVPQGFPSRSLVGLAGLILVYLQKAGRYNMEYAKQVAPLLARTDFGSMFVGDLPRAEAAWLRGDITGRWLRIFSHALAGVPGDLDSEVFAHTPGDTERAGFTLELTRRHWLAQIARGMDLLTSHRFPAARPGEDHLKTAARRATLQGMGGLRDTHDSVGPSGNVAAPVFELRRIRPNRTAPEFAEIALSLFDHVRALNAGTDPLPPYAHTRMPPGLDGGAAG